MVRFGQRLFAAWSLLAVMALMVTPRGLLHRCEVRLAENHEHPAGAMIMAVCPVCDSAVPVALSAEELLEIVPVVAGSMEQVDAVRMAVAPCVLRCADRGPPALI